MTAEGGFGATFNIGDGNMGSTPSYTAIAQVQSVNGFEISQVMTDVTAHDSTGGYREKIPTGLFEVGDVELELIFDITEGTHDNASGGLTHALLNKTELAYQIVLPDTSDTTFTFDAYVSKVGWGSPQEDAIKATVTLTVTGQPTIT